MSSLRKVKTYVVLRARDGHKALQDFLVEDTFRVRRGMVSHEAVDEGESGLRDGHAGEGTVVEDRILVDALLEALAAEGAEDVEVVVGG